MSNASFYENSYFRKGVIIFLIVPIVMILLNHFDRDKGFLELIYFGQIWESGALPEVREIDPPRLFEVGYDGQFYAQIALSPALKNPDLPAAIDNPTYRAQRIGLPLLAYFLGLGYAPMVLQIYALLNVGFWTLLLVVLVKRIGIRDLKDVLLLVGILWSTGTLTSLSKSLTDFPAAALGIIAIVSSRSWRNSTFLFLAAGLIKETSIVSAIAIPVRSFRERRDYIRSSISVLAIGLVILIWYSYVHFRFSSTGYGASHGITWPFVDLISKLGSAYDHLMQHDGKTITEKAYLLFELLAPVSLLTQAIYLMVKPRIRSSLWRFGIGFAFLFCILSLAVLKEQYASLRVCLPLTFAFNFLIHKYEKDYAHFIWFAVGNVGLCMVVIDAFIP